MASWLRAQEHVLSADSSVSDDPWSPGASFSVSVEPAIGDDELRGLAEAGLREASGPGWPRVTIGWTVGRGRSFSNLGGEATLDVFLGLRHDDAFDEVSARGDASCGSNFCVTIDTADPHELHAAVERMLQLAEEAGGVQSNLGFTAASTVGDFTVTAQPEAPVDEAVELWAAIAESVPLESASAWVVQPVGDLAPLQILDVAVADAAAEAAARAVAASLAPQGAEVELRVEVGTDATPSPSAPVPASPTSPRPSAGARPAE